MITLTQQDVQRNMRSVAHAVAQQELEGLKVSEATVSDLHRVARGEIDTDEVIRNIYRRVENDQILLPRPAARVTERKVLQPLPIDTL